MVNRDEFLCPRSRYHGQVKLVNLVFNANLQEFAQRVGYIANLGAGGKISAEESYEHIRILWVQFEFASRQLEIAGKPSSIFHELEN